MTVRAVSNIGRIAYFGCKDLRFFAKFVPMYISLFCFYILRLLHIFPLFLCCLLSGNVFLLLLEKLFKIGHFLGKTADGARHYFNVVCDFACEKLK